MKDYSKVKICEELIDLEHGKIRSESRNKFEKNAQMFTISEMLQVARKEANLSPEQLAERQEQSKAIFQSLEKEMDMLHFFQPNAS